MQYTLSHQKPLASGSEKLIFQHPESEQLLIKIWHQNFFNRTKKRYPFSTRFQRLPRYCALLNEITEHLAVREKQTDSGFIQNIIGLVDTDLGPGLVVEAIRQTDGSLAKTLKQTIGTLEYGPPQEKAIENLLCWLKETDIILRDFGINNLVWDEKKQRFIIIDGIGGRPAISFRHLSRSYNRRSNKKRISKLGSRIKNALQQQNHE